eukprot:3139141-Pyramimonas_sp.AAC.1
MRKSERALQGGAHVAPGRQASATFRAYTSQPYIWARAGHLAPTCLPTRWGGGYGGAPLWEQPSSGAPSPDQW